MSNKQLEEKVQRLSDTVSVVQSLADTLSCSECGGIFQSWKLQTVTVHSSGWNDVLYYCKFCEKSYDEVDSSGPEDRYYARLEVTKDGKRIK